MITTKKVHSHYCKRKSLSCQSFTKPCNLCLQILSRSLMKTALYTTDNVAHLFYSSGFCKKQNSYEYMAIHINFRVCLLNEKYWNCTAASELPL